jgi:sigma-E factor negative regulatory protein RseA
MNDPIKEQLSAFLDGELPPAETELLLRRFDRDAAALESRCGRYRLIGDALRGVGGRVPSDGFAARVHLAVAAETIAPSGRREVARATRAWLRPVAGMGIAAGVAAVAILGLRVDGPGESATSIAQTPPVVSGTATLSSASDGISDASSYVVPVTMTRGTAIVPTRLTNYVVAHSEYSSPLGRRNVLTGLLADNPAERVEPPAQAEAAPESASSPR